MYPTGTNVVKLPIAKDIENANHALAMCKLLRKYIGHIVYQAHNGTRKNGDPDSAEYMMSRLELENLLSTMRHECKTAFNEIRIIIKSKQQELTFYRQLLEEYEERARKHLTAVIRNIAQEPATIQEMYALAQQYGVHQLDNVYRILAILGDVYSTNHQSHCFLYTGPSGQNYYVKAKDNWTVTAETPNRWTYHGKV